MNVVYSREDPYQVAKLGEWTDELLFSTNLPSGEYVSLMQSIEPLPDDFFHSHRYRIHTFLR